VLAPAIGALAMSLSTIIVAFNAMMLNRLDLRPDRDAEPALAAHPAHASHAEHAAYHSS
jgi:hypothetical protein